VKMRILEKIKVKTQSAKTPYAARGRAKRLSRCWKQGEVFGTQDQVFVWQRTGH
jgi:hypothetical protein